MVWLKYKRLKVYCSFLKENVELSSNVPQHTVLHCTLFQSTAVSQYTELSHKNVIVRCTD